MCFFECSFGDMCRRRRFARLFGLTLVVIIAGCASAPVTSKPPAGQPVGGESIQGPHAADPLFHDVHFHLTNYVQEGISTADFLELMGTSVGRSTLFGIPLQQTWSYPVSGDTAPTYYLHSDAPLYYYSFTDASIARAYQQLTPEQQARFDPMITGFNPADMYAADHIRRVLTLFPGVFSGIGEFSVHKEFVTAKVAGSTASLTNPALDRILAFAGETGLVVILHNDLDMPFAAEGTEPVHLTRLKDLFRRHPDTTIIWAHLGLGRVVRPVRAPASAGRAVRSAEHLGIVEAILKDPEMDHVYFDISWSEVAKYIVETPEAIAEVADLVNQYPDRFLFGTDSVAPTDATAYFYTYEMYAPLWAELTPEAKRKVRILNYERLFDNAQRRVRAWERANVDGV